MRSCACAGLHNHYERCAADSASALLLVFLHSESVIPRLLFRICADFQYRRCMRLHAVCGLLASFAIEIDCGRIMAAACGNHRESER